MTARGIDASLRFLSDEDEGQRGGGREAVRAARREEDERKRGAEGERPIEGSDAVGECEAEREARRAETAETAHAAAGCG